MLEVGKVSERWPGGREWWLRDEGSQSPKGVREGGNSMSSADIRTCERTKRQVYRMFGGV